jgi:hypothetical protein
LSAQSSAVAASGAQGRGALKILVPVMAVLFGAVLLRAAYVAGFTIPINYNEGWNAYHAVSALQNPRALYPAPPSLLTNNYPPLSFFIVGAAAKLTGLDAIITGRLIAFLSTLGVGLCLALAARAMGCSPRKAAVAALLFWAAPWVIVKFSAMDDPQMLGNLLDAVALLILVRAPRTIATIALGALFLALAEFIKPLYVTLPLALLVWLFVYERRSAWMLAGFGILFAVLGYALTTLALHVELLGHLFSPRVFLWTKLTGQPGQWLLVEFLPFAAALALFRRKADGAAFFAALYAALAFVLAVFFSGGDGVSASQMMDVSMAVALGGALYWNRAAAARWTLPGVSFAAGFQAVMLVLAFLGVWALRPSLPDLMGTRYATRYDTGVIARRKDPVLCESLALCYWAGRTPRVDAFGITQAFARGARPTSDLTALLDAHAFSMIQLQPRSVFFPPSPLWAAIVRNYYLEHEDKNGLFLIPRD